MENLFVFIIALFLSAFVVMVITGMLLLMFPGVFETIKDIKAKLEGLKKNGKDGEV